MHPGAAPEDGLRRAVASNEGSDRGTGMYLNRMAKTITSVLLFVFALAAGEAFAAASSYQLSPGFNLTAVTRPLQDQYGSAFPLLSAWQASAGVKAVESYDPVNGAMLRAELNADGVPVGADFPLTENRALFVYGTSGAALNLGDIQGCAPVSLAVGFNLASYACAPANYTAREMILSMGGGAVLSISRFDSQAAKWITAGVAGGTVVGANFPIVPGEGYIITTAAAVVGWEPPVPRITAVNPASISTNQPPTTLTITGSYFAADSSVLLDGVPLATTFVSATQLTAVLPTQTTTGSPVLTVQNPDPLYAGGFFTSDPVTFPVAFPAFGFAPNTLTVRQEESGAALTLTIPFAAPAGGVTASLASSNSAVLTVPAGVTIPAGATVATVPLTPLNTGNTTNDVVTITASQSGWTAGQATVTVKPKPTINLSPPTTLTGLTYAYLLTVNLTDTAPAGGLLVSLTATPAGIVSVPASVTVPAGATSAQVTVTTTAVGTATITASSPGLALAGTSNAVTVKPIQTVTYGSVMSASVGVTVTQPAGSGTVNVAYAPLASREVGVTVGPAFTAVSPNHGVVGSTALPVTISGSGLGAVTGISMQPATGVTVEAGSLSIAPDGTSATFLVDIAPDAPISDRTVVVATATGNILPTVAGAATFKVTNVPPQLLSIIPIQALTGTTFTLQLNGTNLFQASVVSFSPPDGISVGNPPSVSADGTLATVNVAIDPAAAPIPRTVTVTTPAGATSTAASPANAFNVLAPAATGTQYAQYTPLASPQVGVLVQPATAPATQDVTYSQLTTVPVGVAVGSVMTGVTPATGAIGTTGMKVKAIGPGLSAATAISFQPADGIAIEPGSFTIEADGNPSVLVDIDSGAPITMRTVMVTLPSGSAPPAVPGANLFRVTLPQPEIYSMQPIRAMVGQSVALNVSGKNLASASSIDFFPATGITVSNPPTVSPDGTLATVNISIAANAPVSDRVVTITTPGWTTSTVPSVANTFHVTADAGTTYTPLVSQLVGVQVGSTTTGPVSTNVTYGPVLSAGVGVMVTPVPAPTAQSVTYAPVVSPQIGVVVGAVVTGMTPASIQPGTTGVFTLTGTGLDTVTGVAVIPATGITVGLWTPAADGLSGTVVLTADASATGTRTVLLQTSGGALQPTVPHATDLLIGYPPAISSISPTLPTVGTSFTLTINGTYLQGVTKVAIVPSDNVEVDANPVWTSDGTGEHVTVRVTIGADAVPGDRVVVLTTPFGVTSSVGSPANTITFFKPLARNDAVPPPAKVVVAHRAWRPGSPLPKQDGREAGRNQFAGVGINLRAHPGMASVGMAAIAPPVTVGTLLYASPGERQALYLLTGYRGPPRG